MLTWKRGQVSPAAGTLGLTPGAGPAYLLGQLLGGQHDQGTHPAHGSLQQGLRGGGCHLCHQGQHPACQPLSEGRVLTLTCTTGMTKASVFPLPVGAETQRSLGR